MSQVKVVTVNSYERTLQKWTNFVNKVLVQFFSFWQLNYFNFYNQYLHFSNTKIYWTEWTVVANWFIYINLQPLHIHSPSWKPLVLNEIDPLVLVETRPQHSIAICILIQYYVQLSLTRFVPIIFQNWSRIISLTP